MTAHGWAISLGHVESVMGCVERVSVELDVALDEMLAAVSQGGGGSSVVAAALADYHEQVEPMAAWSMGRVLDGIAGARKATSIYDEGSTLMADAYDQSVFSSERFGPRLER